MGRIIQELEHALPGLSKAVFSQSIDKLSDEKVVVRPVSTKTGIAKNFLSIFFHSFIFRLKLLQGY